MTINKKKLMIGGVLAMLFNSTIQANELCSEAPIERQSEVNINESVCMTDNVLYLTFNVPFDSSDVVITTSGGTFSGSADAELEVFSLSGTKWNAEDIEYQADMPDSNDESLSFVSDAGLRYLKIRGNIQQTNLFISVTGGEVPPPIGDYIEFDTNVVVELPPASLSNKSEYHALVTQILASSYSDLDTFITNEADAITHVADALHYLAEQDDMADSDVLSLLNFLIAYEDNALPMTSEEAQVLSVAIQAIAKMSGFLSTEKPAGKVQEAFTGAVTNFYKGESSQYFAEILPHIMALVQYHSELTNPFAYDDYIDATIFSVRALGAAAHYGDGKVKGALNQRMTEVLSVMRSFIVLGETSYDARHTTDENRSWLLTTNFKSLARLHNAAADDAQSRINELMIEAHEKLSTVISQNIVELKINIDFLTRANRECASDDPLGEYCLSESDILSVTRECSSTYTIRTQSSVTATQLDNACTDILAQEAKFHQFFNTNSATPVAEDNNATRDIVIFANPEEYDIYSGPLFGINSGGGIYLEGTPSKEGNQPQFIAMACPERWVGGSCDYSGQFYNLKHELTHYLDGRFNQYGKYKHHQYIYAWTEGLAEYLAQGDIYQRTLNRIKGKVIPPFYNVMFMDGDYKDLYQWAYFGIHYLSNEHPQELTLLAQALREADSEQFKTTLQEVVTRVQAGFIMHVVNHSEAIAPATEVIPPADTFGHCNLQQQYVSPIDYETVSVSITNTTDIPVSLFWINNETGVYKGTKVYKTLQQGENFTAHTWRINDRMMLSDSNYGCISVAVMTQTSNNFTITEDTVKDVTKEIIPVANTFGQCDLMQPHIKDKEGTGGFSVTNTTDYPISIVRIDDYTGEPLYSSNYGILQTGESYSSPSWYQNRRFFVADARLNCIAVGVLNNDHADFVIDEAIIANAAPVENIPAPNTIGRCDLIQKHYIDEVGYPMTIVNDSDATIRIHRVLNETGEVNFDNVYSTLEPGESYIKEIISMAWYGKRRAVITTADDQCLGVAVLSQQDSVNRFSVDQALVDAGPTPIDSDGDGVVDSQDAFPNDPNENKDSDGDSVGDNADAFPNDPNESKDSDGDSVGDNSDVFPNDASENQDTDGDGIGDNSDLFPNDANNGISYCSAAGDNQKYEWITGVQLGDKIHTSDNTAGGYNDFTQVMFETTAGSTEAIRLITNNDSDSEYWYVWVDFNQDGDFDDSNELIIEHRTAQATYAKNVNVPAGIEGNLRMRVALTYRSIDNACESFSYGEVEDYTLVVNSDGTSTEPPVEPPTSSTNIPDVCATNSVTTGGRLVPGEAVCLDDDTRRTFTIPDVDAYQSIAIRTAHGTGDISLNFKQGSWPSSASYDAKSETIGTNVECISIDTNSEYWGYLEVTGAAQGASLLVTFNEEKCQ
jgi:hypothetical protein